MSVSAASPTGSAGETCILHLSDLHFGTEITTVTTALHRLSNTLKPDCALVSGDITQRATRTQFRSARGFLRAFGIEPMLVVPGNHDIPLFNVPLRLLAPYRRYRSAFVSSMNPVVMTRHAVICGINTTRRYRHVNGEVSGQQLDRLREHFTALPEDDCRLRIVVVHHPARVFLDEDRDDELRESDRLLDACARVGVDLVVGGHIHRPYVRHVGWQVGDLSRSLWIVQAGTAVSSRTRGNVPNSVNVLRYRPRARERIALLERWDFDAQSAAFVLHSSTQAGLDDCLEQSGE